MALNLIIVESPAKATTIEKYLGKGYKVASCNGHIRDLPSKGMAIDVANKFQPTYQISEGKQSVVSSLRKLAQQAEYVYLASDDDREGESIAWHLKEVIAHDRVKTKRIVFREITRDAVSRALKYPRDIDEALVNSQQARRILDRLVGYALSPILWKKIKRGLSAGRVQSVAVRIVVERERTIHAFQSEVSFSVHAHFDLGENKLLKAILPKKLAQEENVYSFLSQCKTADFVVECLDKKNAKKSPSPPFTTSTLQQEASRKFGYAVARTMRLAQQLYEAGHISYMRTDAVYLSQEATEKARNKIQQEYGEQYVQTRIYKTKVARAEEAHEAIRPTDFNARTVSEDPSVQRLYTLIWKRTIASQMADAQLEKTTATITISTSPLAFIAKGEVIRFDGFLRVYASEAGASSMETQAATTILPPLLVGQRLRVSHITARECFSKPPARYTEATLVKKLEEYGIGRPSTYAPTIATIQKRGYVSKEDREGTVRVYKLLTLRKGEIECSQSTENVGVEKQKLFSTDVAMVVNDFLVKHFSDITDYAFTARVEEELDTIAQGTTDWTAMLSNFYTGFHAKVLQTDQLDRKTVSTTRALGNSPQTGQPILARLGKYGPLVQMGDAEHHPPVKFASLQHGQHIETISLEEALKLFVLPRSLGDFEEAMITVNIGRYGPYVKHKTQFYSLEETDDPFTITLERGILLIQAKRTSEANKVIKRFDEQDDLFILNGKWGPYLKVGKRNIKIPKEVSDPSTLTFSDCLALAEASPKKTQRRKRGGGKR